jgi:hypothetical protein
MNNPLLQISPFEIDCGQLIGRDPRDVPPEGWTDRLFLSGLTAIRAKCLDCAFDPKEVRKCVQTDCPLWPLRMGCVPKAYRIGAIRPKTSDEGLAATCALAHPDPDQKQGDGTDF